MGTIQEDFQCPISGAVIADPVVLNGYLYDREFIEDWIFENDWSDPATAGSKDSQVVGPDDILDCSEEYREIIQRFKDQFKDELNLETPRNESVDDLQYFEREFSAESKPE